MGNILALCPLPWQLGKKFNFYLKFSLEADPSDNWNEMLIGRHCQKSTWSKKTHHPHFSDQRNGIASPTMVSEDWYSCGSEWLGGQAPLRNHWEREVPGMKAGVGICGTIHGTITCGLFENDKEHMSGGTDSLPHFSSLLGASSLSFTAVDSSSFLSPLFTALLPSFLCLSFSALDPWPHSTRTTWKPYENTGDGAHSSELLIHHFWAKA